MPPYLPIPQTPGDKTQFDSQLDGIPSGSDRTGSESAPPRPAWTADRAAEAEEIAKDRRKTASPVTSFHTNTLRPPDVFHRLSIGSVSDAGYGPSVLPSVYQPDNAAPSSSPFTQSTSSRLPPFVLRFWNHNRAVFFVFFAQLFAALMNLFARLLELDEGDHAFHPVQLLFMRMIMTTCASCLYMWRYKVPNFPLGPPGVRWLLVLRGLTGFFGIFGMWYSMMYLPLAEATVFTFLSPSVTGYICHVLLKDPFTRTEQIASAVAFSGIILITRPLSFISHSVPIDTEIDADEAMANMTTIASGTVSAAVAMIRDVASETASKIAAADSDEGVPVLQRLAAILVALVGVLGGSSAFTTIRAIGTRAHPLISVNYFSTWCTIVSGTILFFAPILGVGQPYLQFALPHTLRQWLLLLLICVCGFCTQFLATMGLGLERSNRATAMVYTQMLFAAGFDRFIFGHEMATMSLVGCGLVIGSALWAALAKKPPAVRVTTAAAAATNDIEIGVIGTPHTHHPLTQRDIAREPRAEGVPMLGAQDSDDEDEVDLLDREVSDRR